MNPIKSTVPVRSGNLALLPAIIGAAICLFFIRNGFVFFFLLPLGFIGYGWGPKTLWSATGFAILGNFVLTFFIGMIIRVPGMDMLWDILWFSATAAAFAWTIMPADERSLQIPGSQRLAIGASLSALIFIGLSARAFDSPDFYDLIKNQIEAVSALFFSGIGPEAFDMDLVIGFLRNVIMRGGALVTTVVLLFMNRQLGIFLIRIFGGKRRPNVFVNFHVHPRLFWALLFSVLLLLASNAFAWENFIIVLSNVVILCIMMFLAQGYGIIKYFTLKPAFPPFLRFMLPVFLVIAVFWPGVNAFVFGAIVILGIVENWVAFRPVNISGSPATPQA